MKLQPYMTEVAKICLIPWDWNDYIPKMKKRFPIWNWFLNKTRPMNPELAAILTDEVFDRAVEKYSDYDPQAKGVVRAWVWGMKNNIWNEHWKPHYKLEARYEVLGIIDSPINEGRDYGRYDLGEHQGHTRAVLKTDDPNTDESRRQMTMRQTAKFGSQARRIYIPRDPYVFTEDKAAKRIQQSLRDQRKNEVFEIWWNSTAVDILSFDERLIVGLQYQGLTDFYIELALGAARDFFFEDASKLTNENYRQIKFKGYKKMKARWDF